MKVTNGPHDLENSSHSIHQVFFTNSRSGSKSQSAKHYIQSFTRLMFR